MKYFLIQPENRLVYLPDFFLEVGKRSLHEGSSIGGTPFFFEGRKQPDMCVFSRPSGAIIADGFCRMVDEKGKVLSVRVSSVEIASGRELVAGLVEDTEDFSSNSDAMNLINQVVQQVR